MIRAALGLALALGVSPTVHHVARTEVHTVHVRPVHHATRQHRRRGGAALSLPAGILTQWEKVHVCEGNPWNLHGWRSSGGLGILNGTWAAYRGTMPANAGDATPVEQVVVARRIQLNPPDQSGCNPGGW